MSKKATNPLRSVALVALVTGVAACSSSSSTPPPPRVTRPIAIYSDGGAEWAAVTATAMWRSVEICVRRQGFKLPPRPPTKPVDPSFLSRPFGVESLTEAQERGYHGPLTTKQDSTYDDFYATLSDTELKSLTVAMFGDQTGPAMTDVSMPDGSTATVDMHAFGGCMREARDAVFGGGFEYEALQDQIQEIATSSMTSAISDSRVRSKVEQWAGCMAKSGYSINQPSSAAKDFDLGTSSPSQLEIAMALSDVKCKTEVDLIGIFREVRNGYESAALSARLGLLERWRVVSEESLARAKNIISSTDGRS